MAFYFSNILWHTIAMFGGFLDYHQQRRIVRITGLMFDISPYGFESSCNSTINLSSVFNCRLPSIASLASKSAPTEFFSQVSICRRHITLRFSHLSIPWISLPIYSPAGIAWYRPQTAVGGGIWWPQFFNEYRTIFRFCGCQPQKHILSVFEDIFCNYTAKLRVYPIFEPVLI